MANTLQPMGIGKLGGQDLIFKRKFRWTFRIERQCADRVSNVDEHFVKIASRPNLSIEETEINFLNAKTWIPGKGAWETITVTYYDVATNEAKGIYDWIASVYDFTGSPSGNTIRDLKQASTRASYSGKGILTLYDGCGAALEVWEMQNMWPQAINFGELDYSSSEEVTIELTLRYSEVKYTPVCPNFVIDPCCTPCVTGALTNG